MIRGLREVLQEGRAGIRLRLHRPSLEIVILTVTSLYIAPIFRLGSIPEPLLDCRRSVFTASLLGFRRPERC